MIRTTNRPNRRTMTTAATVGVPRPANRRDADRATNYPAHAVAVRAREERRAETRRARAAEVAAAAELAGARRWTYAQLAADPRATTAPAGEVFTGTLF